MLIREFVSRQEQRAAPGGRHVPLEDEALGAAAGQPGAAGGPTGVRRAAQSSLERL